MCTSCCRGTVPPWLLQAGGRVAGGGPWPDGCRTASHGHAALPASSCAANASTPWPHGPARLHRSKSVLRASVACWPALSYPPRPPPGPVCRCTQQPQRQRPCPLSPAPNTKIQPTWQVPQPHTTPVHCIVPIQQQQQQQAAASPRCVRQRLPIMPGPWTRTSARAGLSPSDHASRPLPAALPSLAARPSHLTPAQVPRRIKSCMQCSRRPKDPRLPARPPANQPVPT